MKTSNDLNMNFDGKIDLHGGYSARAAKRRGRRLNMGFCAIIEATIPKDDFVVDMGSGAYGSYVWWMRDNGWDHVFGIDRSPNARELSNGFVEVGDLTNEDICLKLFSCYPKWIICHEVGEHIQTDLSSRLFRNFVGAEKVLLSWALPGQRGHHHINCRTAEWVACEMGHVGFELDEKNTQAKRKICTARLKRKLMVFVKRKKR